jgi:siroheme synthase-like protein
MRLLSVSLNFEGQTALVIGAGAVGRRKLAALLSAGARLRVVEPQPGPWLLELAAEGLIRLEISFQEEFLDERPFVFVAVSEGTETEAICELVRRKGLWLNTSKSGGRSNFFLPAAAADGPFLLTVSTGGTSPALAARVARELRSTYHGYGPLCRLLGRLRPLILKSGLTEDERRTVFRSLAEDPALAELLQQGPPEAVRERVAGHLEPLPLPADFTF